MVAEAFFVLVFSTASGGSAIEGQFEQNFAGKKECMADRERLLEAHRQSFPPGMGGTITARCKQVNADDVLGDASDKWLGSEAYLGPFR
jgi:hypothetical protein